MNEEKPKHNPQKKEWEDIGTFKSFDEAKKKSDSTERETKIRRCGQGGYMFKVKAVKKYLETK